MNSKYKVKKNELPEQLEKWTLKSLIAFSDKSIIEKVGMSNLPLICHIMKLKHGKIKLTPIPQEHDALIQCGNFAFANMSYLPIILHFLYVKENMLHIEGETSFPSAIDDEWQLIAKANGITYKPDMTNIHFHKTFNGVTYEYRTIFSLHLPLKGPIKIKFYNVVNGLDCCCGKINSMRFFPVSDCIENQYACTKDYVIRVLGNSLCILKSNSIQQKKMYENLFCTTIKKNYPTDAKWAISLRDEALNILKTKKRKIWLFMDRPNKAGDNAQYLFEYVFKNKKVLDVDPFFVIDKNSKDYKKFKNQHCIIDLYSKEHYLKSLVADYVISSQCNGVVENPFWDKAEFFRDLYHIPKLIFLQHGVIKDDMSLTLNRFHTNFHGFITTTIPEYKSILNSPYYYPPSHVWRTGLPVFDRLKNNSKKIIVFMPTWRKYLVQQKWNDKTHDMEWVLKKNFHKSSFFYFYRSLFKNKKLEKVGKDLGYSFALKPHPLIEPYAKELIQNTSVKLMDNNTSYISALNEGCLLVTDYSSLAFEFAYQKKPIIYYQFDSDIFFKTHTYRPGYFQYENDGLGEICYTEDSLIKLLIEYMGSGCKVKEIFLDRMNYLFLGINNCCQKICDYIKESEKL